MLYAAPESPQARIMLNDKMKRESRKYLKRDSLRVAVHLDLQVAALGAPSVIIIRRLWL
jgi:hypothetical protein